jgi:hypothetical protein
MDGKQRDGQLLAHLGLGLPQCPKIVADVVQKNGSKLS